MSGTAPPRSNASAVSSNETDAISAPAPNPITRPARRGDASNVRRPTRRGSSVDGGEPRPRGRFQHGRDRRPRGYTPRPCCGWSSPRGRSRPRPSGCSRRRTCACAAARTATTTARSTTTASSASRSCVRRRSRSTCRTACSTWGSPARTGSPRPTADLEVLTSLTYAKSGTGHGTQIVLAVPNEHPADTAKEMPAGLADLDRVRAAHRAVLRRPRASTCACRGPTAPPRRRSPRSSTRSWT